MDLFEACVAMLLAFIVGRCVGAATARSKFRELNNDLIHIMRMVGASASRRRQERPPSLPEDPADWWKKEEN